LKITHGKSIFAYKNILFVFYLQILKQKIIKNKTSPIALTDCLALKFSIFTAI